MKIYSFNCYWSNETVKKKYQNSYKHEFDCKFLYHILSTSIFINPFCDFLNILIVYDKKESVKISISEKSAVSKASRTIWKVLKILE